MYKTVTREEFVTYLACVKFNGDEDKAEVTLKEAEKGLGECEYAVPVL